MFGDIIDFAFIVRRQNSATEERMFQSIFSIFDTSMQNGTSVGDLVVNEGAVLIYAFIIAASITIACFVLKGIGLYTIAKREGIKNPFLAFIPFASYYLLGKIVGSCKVFGYHVKNLGVIAMIAMLINTALSVTYNVLMYSDKIIEWVQTGVIDALPESYGNVWVDVVLQLSSTIAGLIYIVADVFLVMTFFMYYGKKNQLSFSLLSIFIEPLFGVFVFVVRKNKRFNYSQYVKMRFDSYRGNQSGGGFNNPQQPFATDNKSADPYSDYDVKTQKNKEDIDVFEDYSDKRNDN